MTAMYPPGLEGRVAFVTGVSRHRGIGCAIARKLVEAGAQVFLTHFRDHDLDPPWGADDVDAVVSEIRASAAPGVRIDHTAAFARRHDGRPGGRVVWLTSGQQLGPMPGEVAYATAKAALAGVLPTVADELLDRKILLNAVNPGPVNTGYLSPDTRDRDEETLRAVLEAFPRDDSANPTTLRDWSRGSSPTRADGSWVRSSIRKAASVGRVGDTLRGVSQFSPWERNAAQRSR